MSSMWKKIADKAKSFYAPVKEEYNEACNHFDDVDPELFIKFLQQTMPSVKLLNGLSRKLKVSSADWMLEFLRLGGLNTLLEVLQNLGSHRAKFCDAILELQCVGCIRDVISSDAGLGFMVDSESGLTRQLAAGKQNVCKTLSWW